MVVHIKMIFLDVSLLIIYHSCNMEIAYLNVGNM